MCFADKIINDPVTMTAIKQALLRHMGFVGADGKPLIIDGDYGTDTTYAVYQFQNMARSGMGIELGTDSGENDGDFGEKCLRATLYY